MNPISTSKSKLETDASNIELAQLPDLSKKKPEWMADAIWREIDANDKLKLSSIRNISPPEGIELSQEAWNFIPLDLKDVIVSSYDKTQTKAGKEKKNNVYSFFFEKDTSIERVEGAVNNMALINALLLTIPFAFMTSLNSDYYTSLKDALSHCQGRQTHWGATADSVYAYQLTYMSCSIYSCIVALILAIVFLIFKTENVSMSQKIKIRVLVTFLFITTVSTFVALLNLVGSIFDFYMADLSEVCESSFGNGGKYGWPGNAAATLGFLFAVYIMM